MTGEWCIDKVPLFNAASELEQLTCVMRVLGTYDPSTWASPDQLPDFSKIHFAPTSGIPLQDVLPQATQSAVKLVQACVRYAGVPPRLCSSIIATTCCACMSCGSLGTVLFCP